MSKTVDERVVEMRFDNAQFERNVQTSMSTLDKLKQSLKLKDAAKGLDGINKAAKNFDVSPLSNGIETVKSKFSALEIMGVTALVNLTNSAVNAGKRIVSALTIEPVKSGFQEYETQINAVQTILANTQKEGTNIDRVNAALDELNKYADLTIYNFTEMTRNIGTFTAAGVKLDDSVSAIKGIANLAAVSGSTSQQASTAMYQLSQALAAGTVKLMDWNSVVNAGMGGQVFQDALIRTSEHLQTGAKAAIETEGSFRESLKTGWLTTEVLTQTLDQFATAADTQQEYEAAVKKFVDQGYTQEEAKQMADMARTAGEAATKVKTFTQLWDVLKEAAQSGWSQTWRLIVGDFEEAKVLFTDLSDRFTNVINKISESRNKLLGGALNSKWDTLIEKINEAGISTDDFVTALKHTARTHNIVIEDLINDETSLADVMKSGAVSSDIVIETIKSLSGEESELAKSSEELAGSLKTYTVKNGDWLCKIAREYGTTWQDIYELNKDIIEDPNLIYEGQVLKLSEAEEDCIELTKEQADAIRDLAKAAEESGTPINDLITNLEKPSGRELLLDSLKNILDGVSKAIGAVASAWRDIFPAMTSDQLYSIIEAFHSLTEHLVMNDETADKLRRTFRGLFAILDIIRTIVGGAFKLSFKILSKVLGAFDMDVLDLTANIGDAIVKFRDFMLNNELVNKAVDLLAKGIVNLVKGIKTLYTKFKNLSVVQNFIQKIKDAFSNLKDIDLREVGRNIVDGLKNGIGDGIKSIPSAIINFAKTIIDTFCDILGIHSPSKVFFEFGKNIVEGLANGIKFAIQLIVNGIKFLADKIIEIFSKIDFEKLLIVIPIAAVIFFGKKLYDTASVLINGIMSFNEVIEGLAAIEINFSKVLKAYATNLKAEAFKKIAISLAILIGAIIALTFVDTDKLYDAVTVVAILSGILVGLAFAMDKLNSISVNAKIGKGGGFNVEGLKTGLIAIGASLLLLAATVKIIGSMNPDQCKQGFIGLAGLIVAIGAVFAAYGLLIKGNAAMDIDKAGSMILKISVALLLLVGVCKLASKLSFKEMGKAAAFIAGFTVFVAALILVTKKAGYNINEVGSMILKISMALLLLIGVVKLASKLSWTEMGKAAAFMAGFTVFVGALVFVTKIGNDKQIAKIGGLLMAISTSLLMMVAVCKLVGKLSPEEMIKGGIFVAAFTLLILALANITKIGNEEKMGKVAGTILAMSIAIGILAGVAILLSLMPLSGLAKGVGAIAVLGLIMAAMIEATQGANKCVGNLVVMTVAITLMAGAVVMLSAIDGKKLAGATAALSIVMGMFALMAASTGKMKKAMGTLIVMTVAVGMLAGVLYLLAQLPVESTLSAAISLSTLLLAFSASCLILGGVGKLGSAAFVGIGVLAALIVAVGALIIGIGALVDQFPALETFLDKGIPVLEKIGYAIGSFFGNIIGGLSAGITSGLPTIGEHIGAFAEKLKMVDDDAVSGAANAAQILLMLGGAQLVSSLANFLSIFGGTTIEDLGVKLVSFGDAVVAFSQKVSGNIDSAAVEAASSAGMMIAKLYESLPKSGGWVQGIFGESMSLDTFGSQLKSFGEAIVSFSSTISGNVDTEAVESAANAGRTIASLYEVIPKGGGWVQEIFGVQDLGVFGTQLKSFGEAIVSFSDTLTERGGVNSELIDSAVNAGKTVAGLYDVIPKGGGWAQEIFGEQNLNRFSDQMVTFGEAIVSFSDTLSQNGGINTKLINSATNAGKTVAGLYDVIPKGGGWAAAIFGEQNLETFGDQMVAFGSAIARFSNKVSENGGINQASIDAAVNAGKTVAGLYDALPKEEGVLEKIKNFFAGGGTMTMDEFGTLLSGFGSAVSAFYSSLSEIDPGALSNAVTQAENLTKLMDDMVDLDITGVVKFASGIGQLTESGIDEFASAFSSVDSTLVESVKSMIESLAQTIVNGKTKISTAFNTLMTSSVSGLKINNQAFVSAGLLMTTELSVGILSGSALVSAAISTTLTRSVSLFSNGGMTMYQAGFNMMGGLTRGISASSSNVGSTVAKVLSGCTSSVAKTSQVFQQGGANLMTRMGAGIKSGSNGVTTVVKSVMTNSLRAVTSRESAFNQAGRRLMNYLTNGIKAGANVTKIFVSTTISGLTMTIRNQYFSFYNAGTYLVSGFAAGIKANTSSATTASSEMAKAAYSAAKKELAINSPSKKFRKMATSIPEGFAAGIDMLGGLVKKSAVNMANTAINSTKNALSKVSKVVNGSVDVEPTIRPVFDMTSVGVGDMQLSASINTSFVKPIGSLSQIVASAQDEINASNHEVITAINGLRDDLNALYASDDEKEIALYVDSKKLASSIAKPMNRQLNILSRRGAY